MNRAARTRSLRSSLVVFGIAFAGALVQLTGASSPPAGGNGPLVCRVEEDWKLVLNEPGTEINAPQFHTAMSPFGNLDRQYAQVLWNYRESPDFLPGGLQLETWDGENDLNWREVGDTSLSRDAETITWTQRLENLDTSVRFMIVNGHSLTWGAFGGEQMAMSLSVSVPSLAGYSTAVSRENSGVTFGANRVNLLVITEVRYYDRTGTLIHTDTAPVVVHDGSL